MFFKPIAYFIPQMLYGVHVRWLWSCWGTLYSISLLFLCKVVRFGIAYDSCLIWGTMSSRLLAKEEATPHKRMSEKKGERDTGCAISSTLLQVTQINFILRKHGGIAYAMISRVTEPSPSTAHLRLSIETLSSHMPSPARRVHSYK